MISLLFVTALAFRAPPSLVPMSALVLFAGAVPMIPSFGGAALSVSVLSNSLQLDTLAQTMILLVLVNSWSAVLSIFSMSPAQCGTLTGLLGALASICLMFFIQASMMKLYVYFELSLVPIFLILMGWGYQSERVLAAKSMMLYTMGCSLPLLVSILGMEALGASFLDQRSTFPATGPMSEMVAMAGLVAFLVKLPLMFLHMWLPKAHVEAPVLGSMFLAAVLLKLGGVGLVKIMITSESANSVLSFFTSMAIWSLLLVSLLCVQASDMKVLIAFSSVAHMALVLVCAATGASMGYSCLGLILLSHGISSSMAFFMSFLIYKMTASRSMLLNKGMAGVSGLMLFFWAICILGVMGAPPSFNLWVEMMAFFITMSVSPFSLKFLLAGAFLTGAYSFVLVSVPIVANSQFYLCSGVCESAIEKVHLFYSLVGLVGLSVVTPLVF